MYVSSRGFESNNILRPRVRTQRVQINNGSAFVCVFFVWGCLVAAPLASNIVRRLFQRFRTLYTLHTRGMFWACARQCVCVLILCALYTLDAVSKKQKSCEKKCAQGVGCISSANTWFQICKNVWCKSGPRSSQKVAIVASLSVCVCVCVLFLWPLDIFFVKVSDIAVYAQRRRVVGITLVIPRLMHCFASNTRGAKEINRKKNI